MIRQIAISLILTAACASASKPQTAPVVPLPAEMKTCPKASFRTDRAVGICVDEEVDPSVVLTANLFACKITGRPECDDNPAAIISITSDACLAAEAYLLKVSPDTIYIGASSPAGFFYAFQTLTQLHGSSPESDIMCVEISDTPRMKWRGLMIDEGRHFFGKEQIKKVLDLMALYKLNRFHWHLTEDQGWRIEIKKWPKLTTVGAWRDSEKIAWHQWQAEKLEKPYGGFYTQDDIREIVDYARERFIEIIPEIDLPGHTQAMVASYPEILACDPESTHEVWDQSGVSNDVMNVASPEAAAMAKDIIDELIELFPYGYIHLGGDECPTKKWQDNDLCRARLKEIGSDDYRDLQLDFYRSLQRHIDAKPADKRRKLIFWNEVLHGNTSMLSGSTTIMSWIGTAQAEADGRKAASLGYNVIMTPQVPYYINRRQSVDPREPRTQGEGTETLEKVYGYRPLSDVPSELTSRYLGVQANFWSEFVPDGKTLEYLLLPRLTAVAEAAWTPDYRRDYGDYLNRLRPQHRMLTNMGYNFAPYVFEE